MPRKLVFIISLLVLFGALVGSAAPALPALAQEGGTSIPPVVINIAGEVSPANVQSPDWTCQAVTVDYTTRTVTAVAFGKYFRMQREDGLVVQGPQPEKVFQLPPGNWYYIIQASDDGVHWSSDMACIFWVKAIETPTPTPSSTATPTATPTSTPTSTATSTSTSTPVPPTATATKVPPTPTNTATPSPVPPTPTATSTPAPRAECTVGMDENGVLRQGIAWWNFTRQYHIVMAPVGVPELLAFPVGPGGYGFVPLPYPGATFEVVISEIGFHDFCGTPTADEPSPEPQAPSPTVRCTVGDDDERIVSWTGLNGPIQLVVIYGGDWKVPYEVGPEDGSLPVGEQPVWWEVTSLDLKGDCETREVFLPLVESNH